VGILDLISRRPFASPYTRLMYPSFASVMPQVVAVWAERMGHEVVYLPFVGYENLRRELPGRVDLLFVSAFTPAAYLAYGISRLFRERGVVTVLGGPHARSFAEDAREHYDYVVQDADESLVRELLRDPAPRTGGGAVLCASRPPASLPGVRERWKFARIALAKSPVPGVVPMIGSLGCPYRCSFCVDATVHYRTLPRDQIREDLTFIQRAMPVPAASWHDPNFAVRFDETLDLIEECVPPGRVRFIAESSLSLLRESRLRRLQRNGFVAMMVGIESWFAFNDKALQGSRVGEEKLEGIAEHVALITRHVPYTQANFVWGLDADAGSLPFELTRRFLKRVPAAFPSHSLFTAFGNAAPLGKQMTAQRRILEVPFSFLDGSAVHNVRLKSYRPADFYARLAGLVEDSYSRRASMRRFLRSAHSLGSAGRWMTLVRSRASASRAAYYRRLAANFDEDAEFRAFAEGGRAPAFFRHAVRRELGPFFDMLPAKVVDALEGPEAASLRTGRGSEGPAWSP
jgi:hypothetical protein